MALMHHRLPTVLLFAVLGATTVAAAGAQNDPLAGASASAASRSVIPEMPLPALPKLKSIQRPPPKAEAIEELATRLDQLTNTEVQGPLDDSTDLSFLTADVDEQLVDAIGQRLKDLQQQIDGAAAVKILKKARKAGRKAIRKRAKEGNGKRDDDGDWLTFVLSLAEKDNQHWVDTVQLYAMLRMLESAKTPAATRLMVNSYAGFGELVRIDLQRAIARLKDYAVPALLEATKHDARKVRSWARRQLDGLGRAIPGEAVSTTDPVVLAAVLRAFGRIRDNDATRVILSFANADRSDLRSAAREAVAAMGAPAAWHLKDTYKTLTGNKPPRAWDHVRTARELFRLYDRARLSEVYRALERGHKALADNRIDDAVLAFDAVLTRAPLIDGRDKMAPAYQARAEQLAAAGKADEALAMLRKALRLASPAADNSQLRARLYYLEGKQLVAAGTPDVTLLKRAIELDPAYQPAQTLLASLDQKAAKRQTIDKRYVAVGVIGVLGLAGMVMIVRRRPKNSDEPRNQQHRDQRKTAFREPDEEPFQPTQSEAAHDSPSADTATNNGDSDSDNSDNDNIDDDAATPLIEPPA